MSRFLWSKQLSPCHIHVCIRTKSDNRGSVHSCFSSAKPCLHNTLPLAPVGLGITHEMLGYSYYWAHFSMVLRVLWGIHESLWNGWITYSYLPHELQPGQCSKQPWTWTHGGTDVRMPSLPALSPPWMGLDVQTWLILFWQLSTSSFVTMHYGYENLDPRCF